MEDEGSEAGEGHCDMLSSDTCKYCTHELTPPMASAEDLNTIKLITTPPFQFKRGVKDRKMKETKAQRD